MERETYQSVVGIFYTELYPSWRKTVENTGKKFYSPSINTSK